MPESYSGTACVYLKHLSLRNFRNYRELELHLPPGLVALHGENGHGKSNLLEAVYFLALTRSHRAEAERELVRFEALEELPYTRVLGSAQRIGDRTVSVQIDMGLSPPTNANGRGPGGSLRKSIRVDGIPRLASTAVGAISVVSFAAEDIALVTGPPAGRRRFLDVLASQTDRGYLRALQRYQRVLTQRNHLLRRIRERSAQPEELVFWDAELSAQGARILLWRRDIVLGLAPLAGRAYQEMAPSGETLDLGYVPSVEPDAPELELAQRFQQRLASLRPREIALGQTLAGPHRDDLRLLVRGRGVGVYGSRGEARSTALALRIAESELLAQRTGEEPVLLLDDVLSELDAYRAQRVLERALRAQQALLTTANLEQHPDVARQASTTLLVREGVVIPAPTRL